MSERAAVGSRIDELRSALGTIALPADRDEYPVDGMTPEIVLRPRDEAEMARALAEAAALRLSVITRGGGEHMALGNTPESYDAALSVERMPRTIEHDRAAQHKTSCSDGFCHRDV